MAVIPLTSLSQFNNTVSSQSWCPWAVQLAPRDFLLLLSDRSDLQINTNRVAIIYFWAYWCGPCRGMTPIFDGVANSGSLTGVDFYKVNIDQANEIVQHVGGQTVRLFVLSELLAYNKALVHPLMRERRVHIDPWLLRVSARPETWRAHRRMSC